MCDLVKQETERIDSRFLEPACGGGNFLAEILRRKLAVVTKKYKKSAYDWERNSLLAIGTLYGVDIQIDNVLACQDRLFRLVYLNIIVCTHPFITDKHSRQLIFKIDHIYLLSRKHRLHKS